MYQRIGFFFFVLQGYCVHYAIEFGYKMHSFLIENVCLLIQNLQYLIVLIPRQ